jgi:hypothetical protein
MASSPFRILPPGRSPIATRVVPALNRDPDARDVRCLAGEPQNELLCPTAGDPILRTTLPCLRGVCASPRSLTVDPDVAFFANRLRDPATCQWAPA